MLNPPSTVLVFYPKKNIFWGFILFDYFLVLTNLIFYAKINKEVFSWNRRSLPTKSSIKGFDNEDYSNREHPQVARAT